MNQKVKQHEIPQVFMAFTHPKKVEIGSLIIIRNTGKYNVQYFDTFWNTNTGGRIYLPLIIHSS
jgi:hypothetical protein